MKFTFTTKGDIELSRDGVLISKHTVESKAVESAVNHASLKGDGEYRIKFPEKALRVIGVLAPSGDTQAPTQPQNFTATAINRQRIDLSWTASTDNVGVTGYQIFRGGSPLTTTTDVTYSDTTVTASTSYSYTVVAFDAAGNNSIASSAASATTPANAAPVWQTISAQSLIVGNSFSLNLSNFLTDADADTITYSIASGTLPSGITRTGAIVSGTPTTAGQTGAVVFDAYDGFVHVTTSVTFTTYSVDVTAPPVPTGLAASAGSTSVSLSWTASTDAAGSANEFVTGTQDYKVYRSTDGTNFTLRTTVTTNSYSDTGLSTGATYYYKVSARDVALNESAQTTAVSATTTVATSVTTLTLTSATTGTLPWTFAHVFKQGDVPASRFITTDANDSQADVRNRWSDGSARLAVLSGISAFTANTPKTVTIGTTSTAPSGSTVTEPTTIDYVVTLTGGVTGTYTLQSCLGVDLSTWNKLSSGRIRQIPGRVMSEFHYYKPTSDPHLALWFYVRKYSTGAIEVELVVENGWMLVTSPTVKTYGVTVAINGSSVYSASLTHYHHTRWSRVDWVSGGNAITPKHNVIYVRGTAKVPNYGYTSPSTAKLNGLSQTLNPTPFQLGDWNEPMGETGTQAPIGLLPQHEAIYWASGDSRAYASVISNNRGAGRWPIFYRDETTGRVPLYASYKTRSLTQGWGTPVPQGTGGGPIWDIPHHFSMGFSAYLIEGRWSQMECCQFSAMNCNLETDTSRRGSSGGELQIGSPLTTRGLGWAIRSVGQAAAITPTKVGGSNPPTADLAMQTAFAGSIDVTMAYTKARFMDAGGAELNTLGYIGHYFGDDDEDPGIWGRVWMADFQDMSVCHIHSLGIENLNSQANLTAVRDFVCKDVVRRFGTNESTGWNYRRAALYNMPYQDNSEVFLTTAAAFAIYKTAKGLPALSANLGDTLKNHSENTDMTANSSSNDVDGYWGITATALAHCVDAGASGASTAWSLMSSATNFNPSSHGASDKPQFGVIPRNSTALALAASRLSAGQSILFGTIPLSVIQNNGEGAPMTKYGSSGVWDPIRKEVGFIGKRDSSGFPYHWLVYDEATDTWSSSRAVWSGGEVNQNGHGYDHNACDPATGNRYHRPYSSPDVKAWNGTWTTLATIPSPSMDITGTLEWFPGIGLIYSDRWTIRSHPGLSNPSASWTMISNTGQIGNAYHSAGAYNSNSNVYIWGLGNFDNAMKQMTASQVITSIPTCPIDAGASELQGLLCADPAGLGFITWQKASTSWRFWKPGDSSWSTLTQSTGSGATAQNGLPNLDTNTAGRHSINIPISTYGVIMYVQATSTIANVWLYRHS